MQQRLGATLHTEPIENWFTIDANAYITQQTISAFGIQSPDPALGNNNRTETRSLSVTPAIRGSLAGWADYRLWATYSVTSTDADRSRGDFDSVSAGASLAYSGARPLGWSIDYTHNEDNYAGRRNTYYDTARFSLHYKPTYDLRLTASTGYETSNAITIRENKFDIWGIGVDWSPSPRTSLCMPGIDCLFNPARMQSDGFLRPAFGADCGRGYVVLRHYSLFTAAVSKHLFRDQKNIFGQGTQAH